MAIKTTGALRLKQCKLISPKTFSMSKNSLQKAPSKMLLKLRSPLRLRELTSRRQKPPSLRGEKTMSPSKQLLKLRSNKLLRELTGVTPTAWVTALTETATAVPATKPPKDSHPLKVLRKKTISMKCSPLLLPGRPLRPPAKTLKVEPTWKRKIVEEVVEEVVEEENHQGGERPNTVPPLRAPKLAKLIFRSPLPLPWMFISPLP
jgi:hypothetical protein